MRRVGPEVVRREIPSWLAADGRWELAGDMYTEDGEWVKAAEMFQRMPRENSRAKLAKALPHL